MAKKLTGVVQKIDFTQGGAGNQWTTINDIRYVTFWDVRAINWKLGDTVEFISSDRPLWHGQPNLPHAGNIMKLASS